MSLKTKQVFQQLKTNCKTGQLSLNQVGLQQFTKNCKNRPKYDTQTKQVFQQFMTNCKTGQNLSLN